MFFHNKLPYIVIFVLSIIISNPFYYSMYNTVYYPCTHTTIVHNTYHIVIYNVHTPITSNITIPSIPSIPSISNIPIIPNNSITHFYDNQIVPYNNSIVIPKLIDTSVSDDITTASYDAPIAIIVPIKYTSTIISSTKRR